MSEFFVRHTAGRKIRLSRIRVVRVRRVQRVLRRPENGVANRLPQKTTLRVEVQQVGSKLIPDPERAIVHAGDRLDIEVRAGQ